FAGGEWIRTFSTATQKPAISEAFRASRAAPTWADVVKTFHRLRERGLPDPRIGLAGPSHRRPPGPLLRDLQRRRPPTPTSRTGRYPSRRTRFHDRDRGASARSALAAMTSGRRGYIAAVGLDLRDQAINQSRQPRHFA